MDKGYRARAILQVRALRKRYGAREVLTDLSIELGAGEALALLGVNGAGKSTSLRILAGAEPSDSGTVLIDGHDQRTNPVAAKRRAGYVADEPFLYGRLTGLEYLSLMATVYRSPLDRALGLAKSLKLEEQLDELCGVYSHGMRRKLAFAAALFHDPALLLLDEGLVGFDGPSRETAVDALGAAQQHGRAILFSTHESALLATLATRAIILSEGRSDECSLEAAAAFLEGLPTPPQRYPESEPTTWLRHHSAGEV